MSLPPAPSPSSGTMGDVETSIWQIVVRLVQNALFKAILPGLEHQLGRD